MLPPLSIRPVHAPPSHILERDRHPRGPSPLHPRRCATGNGHSPTSHPRFIASPSPSLHVSLSVLALRCGELDPRTFLWFGGGHDNIACMPCGVWVGGTKCNPPGKRGD